MKIHNPFTDGGVMTLGGSLFPVDPHAPVYDNPRCPPGCDWYRPNWSNGELQKDNPRRRPVGRAWRFPIDPNAPKGKKPVFIPLPEIEYSKYIDPNRLPYIKWDIYTWRRAADRAIQEYHGFKPMNVPPEIEESVRRMMRDLIWRPFVSDPLDDPHSAWSSAFRTYLPHPEPSTPDDIPDDIFNCSEMAELPADWEERAERIWNLLDNKLIDDEMKKTKGQRITLLETKVEMLRDQNQDLLDAMETLQKKMEDSVAGRMAGDKLAFIELDGTVRPMIGEIVHGTYGGQRVLLWNNGGDWFMQAQGFGTHGQIAPDLIKNIVWFKYIPSGK